MGIDDHPQFRKAFELLGLDLHDHSLYKFSVSSIKKTHLVETNMTNIAVGRGNPSADQITFDQLKKVTAEISNSPDDIVDVINISALDILGRCFTVYVLKEEKYLFVEWKATEITMNWLKTNGHLLNNDNA